MYNYNETEVVNMDKYLEIIYSTQLQMCHLRKTVTTSQIIPRKHYLHLMPM